MAKNEHKWMAKQRDAQVVKAMEGRKSRRFNTSGFNWTIDAHEMDFRTDEEKKRDNFEKFYDEESDGRNC